MTLLEKFYPYSDNEYSEKWTNAENCEDVADEFAIGFAEWSSFYKDKNRNSKLVMLHAKSKYDESYTTKELLEIYKKEKGL
jgi:hypothetical protein